MLMTNKQNRILRKEGNRCSLVNASGDKSNDPGIQKKKYSHQEDGLTKDI